ncbi:hypothetical protein R5R35_001769 [Gryllus longicercus]|uniref:Uncharacterized protein n=1 Tax=Gryllus longicercus TaxID=2509291 RepID=A0AAN9VYD1_9ORTH
MRGVRAHPVRVLPAARAPSLRGRAAIQAQPEVRGEPLLLVMFFPPSPPPAQQGGQQRADVHIAPSHQYFGAAMMLAHSAGAGYAVVGRAAMRLGENANANAARAT